MALFQNFFTFSPKEKPLTKPSCYNVGGQCSSKRTLVRSHSAASFGTPRIKTVLPQSQTQGYGEGLDDEKMQEEIGGIGIVNFFKGKTIFITGATGFLAKVLIEKLLRSIPDVGKIYLMINAESQEAATKRLENEIIKAEVFKCLVQVHGKSFERFMLSKLIPVAGNLCEPNLGFDTNMESTMVEDVDIIINSAATTNFRERFDVAVDVNVKGAQKVMAFAKKCKKLNLFLQISTAYVNGERKGKFIEKSFRIDKSVAMENHHLINENLNIEDELVLASISRKTNATSQEMKMLGLERARIYGWENVYVFTKAMGEMLLQSDRGDVPLVILRPSIIESTCKDPFPGWIEGNRMMDPVITFYGQGKIFGFPSSSDCPLDVIPVDMVVNAALVAIAKHGQSKKSDIDKVPVYHVASSVENPMLLKDFGIFLQQHFANDPLFDSKGEPVVVKPFNFYNTLADYLSHTERELLKMMDSSLPNLSLSKKRNMSRKLELFHKKTMLQMEHIGAIYEPYGSYGGRFDNTRTKSLVVMMSEEERRIFYFDIGSIDWEDYLVHVHIPGLRRHVLKC